MSRRLRIVIAVVVALALLAGILVYRMLRSGFSTHEEPSVVEVLLSRTMRSFAAPADLRGTKNELPFSPAVLADGRAHWADHCAVCHGNDGSGDTEMGRGLYPRAPDMRMPATQNLSDGELFYIIENGVRLTGMPAWSTGTKEGETSSWHLVHFIRHLPKLNDEETALMESLNPKSPEQVRQEIEAEKFLQGGDPQPPSPDTQPHTGAH